VTISRSSFSETVAAHAPLNHYTHDCEWNTPYVGTMVVP